MPRDPKVGRGVKVDPVVIRQWRCVQHCAFREYPSYLLRYKHYVVDVIDAGLDTRAQGITVEAFCEDWDLPDARTPTRWIAGFVQRLQSVGRAAERRLRALATSTVRPASTAEWYYAYVWGLLSQLQAACTATFHPVSRPHFIFSL